MRGLLLINYKFSYLLKISERMNKLFTLERNTFIKTVKRFLILCSKYYRFVIRGLYCKFIQNIHINIQLNINIQLH
jgi:hypothetical protein